MKFLSLGVVASAFAVICVSGNRFSRSGTDVINFDSVVASQGQLGNAPASSLRKASRLSRRKLADAIGIHAYQLSKRNEKVESDAHEPEEHEGNEDEKTGDEPNEQALVSLAAVSADKSENEPKENEAKENEPNENELKENEPNENELKENEPNENELKENEPNENELKENEPNENELKENEPNENELKENEPNENELKENEPNENELKENEPNENELKENEPNENELKENEPNENELKENEPNENELKENELKENEPKENEPKENEAKENEPKENEVDESEIKNPSKNDTGAVQQDLKKSETSKKDTTKETSTESESVQAEGISNNNVDEQEQGSNDSAIKELGMVSGLYGDASEDDLAYYGLKEPMSNDSEQDNAEDIASVFQSPQEDLLVNSIPYLYDDSPSEQVKDTELVNIDAPNVDSQPPNALQNKPGYSYTVSEHEGYYEDGDEFESLQELMENEQQNKKNNIKENRA